VEYRLIGTASNRTMDSKVSVGSRSVAVVVVGSSNNKGSIVVVPVPVATLSKA